MTDSTPPPLNRLPRMMQEYLVSRLRDGYSRHHSRVMALSNADEARAYCASVKTRIREIFGLDDAPAPTPLNVRMTGVVPRADYEIRNLLFESAPGFTVAANLYVPKGFSGLRPAAICQCGHHWDGKAFAPYQGFARELARMGYISLIFDPVGQGERVQFPDGKGESLFGAGPTYPSVKEHNALDRQMTLTGDWLGRWFVRDARCALTLLLQQENVDPSRVGATGNSGGGTLTTFLTACDDRITMAAPSCWIGSWHHNGINEEPQDAEQFPPGILAAGLEQSDFYLARAPNPVILLTQEQDFFDQRGAREAYQRIRHVYNLLGAGERAAYHVGPGTHGFQTDAREAMYAFFNQHAGLDAPKGETNEPAEAVETLRCSESGQVSDLASNRCLPFFTRQRSRELTLQRGAPAGAELRTRVTTLLNLPPRPHIPPYRILRDWNDRGYARPHASHFLLESDPAHQAQVMVTKLEDVPHFASPSRGEGPAMLYVPHLSSDQEMREVATVRAWQTQHPAFFACDYRGIGESRPDTCRPNTFHYIYGSDYHYASYAFLMGESYVAWRVHDILCTLDWMASFNYNEVHLTASGWGAVPAALAALLDPRVQQITLRHAPESFATLAEAPWQTWPYSAMLPNVLQYFDLPDIYRELRTKHLTLQEPAGTEGPT